MTMPSKIAKARAALIIDHPFFASMLLPMPIFEDSTIPTMATDGDSIRFNAEWTDSLTLSEVTFVLAHEVMHCIFDHMGRRENRTPNRWNQAADYIINGLLVAEKVGTMPKGGLLDANLTKKGGETAEGVYRILPESSEQKKAGDKGGALDTVHDSGTEHGTKPTDAAMVSAKSAEIKVRVIQAKNAAKMQGKLSAGIARLVEEVTKPKVDWKEVLRNFISEKAKTDYSYARPKRRFLAEDFFLPSLQGERMGKLVVAVDCSGSVDTRLLSLFASEINAIREDTRPSAVDIIYFDSKVCDVQTVSEEEPFTINPVGGGGTAFSPVIEKINAMEEQPVAVVFLTDLVCSDFGECPAYPVLWAVLDGLSDHYRNVPYGQVVEVTPNE